ncbi:TonB-dependent receptor [Sphingomonas sp.]|uniref:TonB-dependent receptor n=1 Tax=Sphingomonas sp. TaxID=28214 RepID=UPI0035C8302B
MASMPAYAQVVGARADDDIVVTGTLPDTQLDTESEVGSRSGLSNREIPATLTVIDQAALLERGARTTVDALNAVPGVVSASLPSIPGVTSIRGFTGDAVSQLFDGVRQPFMRVFDSWSFERVEVLKGPASILYGEGALAGAINFVPKRPVIGKQFGSGLASYGSFDTLRLAGDVNQPLGERASVRGYASYSRSSGYVDDTDSELFAGTLAVKGELTHGLVADLAVDVTTDDASSAYWGTPLVPREVARDPTDLVRSPNGYVIDRSLRRTNYEFENSSTRSRTVWARSNIAWQISENVRLVNQLDFYDAIRRWRDSERYSYIPESGMLRRDITRIDHDNDIVTERFFASVDTSILGLRSRSTIGVEYSDFNFENPRSFGTAAPAALRDPVRGLFPDLSAIENFAGAGNRTVFRTGIVTKAVFAEEALNLTPDLLLVGGLRFDDIELKRRVTDLNANTNQTFGQDYHPFSWRAGVVYGVAEGVELYGQYNRASLSIASLALIGLADTRFRLSTGETAEGGVKATLFDRRLTLTAAGYWIRQNNIVTRDPNNAAISIQGGRQSSRGGEGSASLAIADALRIDAGYAYTDARYDVLREAGGNRAGNRPPFVSDHVGNLFAIWRRPGDGPSISAGLRAASSYFTDTANTIRVRGYAVADASVGYRLGGFDLDLRVRNLTDSFYATWRGGSVTQLMIAPPRSVDLTLTGRF